MIETLKKEWQAQTALGLLILLTIWFFISPQFQQTEGERFLGDFPSIYGVMAVWGGIWGMFIAKKWGLWKSSLGNAMIFFSFGLFAQVFGQIAYAYYSFIKHIDVPYPSVGDLGYFGSIPLYIYATIMLAQVSGVHINLTSLKSKIQAVIIPLIMLCIGYFLFLQNYTFENAEVLRTVLDFGYPLGQAFYISIGILTYSLTRGMLGGIMKSRILFFLIALVFQFLADYVFLLQVYYEQWSVGGWNDYMYLIAYFFMTIALIQLKTVSDKLNKS